jgi:hypothetical protein
MNFLVQKRTFKALALGMFFQKQVNMALQRKKVCKDLKYVSIKYAQVNLQKCIIWLKKSGKARQEWNKACVETGICPRKLNIPMKTT